MKNIIYLSLLLNLFSCSKKHEGEQYTGIASTLISISDNENAGIKDVLKYTGGLCRYPVGYSALTSTRKKKFFELEISKNSTLEKRLDRLNLTGANIAYLFYRNLKSEAKNYDEIHTAILLRSGEKKKFKFTMHDLEIVKNKMRLADEVVSIIAGKRFSQLEHLIDNKLMTIKQKNEIIQNLPKVDSRFGLVQEFRPLGFEFGRGKDGARMLHIAGFIIRDRENNAFSVYLSADSLVQTISAVTYEL